MHSYSRRCVVTVSQSFFRFDISLSAPVTPPPVTPHPPQPVISDFVLIRCVCKEFTRSNKPCVCECVCVCVCVCSLTIPFYFLPSPPGDGSSLTAKYRDYDSGVLKMTNPISSTIVQPQSPSGSRGSFLSFPTGHSQRIRAVSFDSALSQSTFTLLSYIT